MRSNNADGESPADSSAGDSPEARNAAIGHVVDVLAGGGSIGSSPVRSLLPDLPPGAALQIDAASLEGAAPVPAQVSLVDTEHSEGLVIRFLPPVDADRLRVQLLMTFGDVPELPLGEMVVRFDPATGDLIEGVGLAY